MALFFMDQLPFVFIFLVALFCFFLGLLAPKVPRLIFPFLDFMSPFPIEFYDLSEHGFKLLKEKKRVKFFLREFIS